MRRRAGSGARRRRRRGRDVVAGSGSGLADVAVTEGDAETADDHARQAGDDGEGYALLQGVGLEATALMSLPLRWSGSGRVQAVSFRYQLAAAE